MKSSDMKNAICFDEETLGRYAYRLTDEPVASQVREHLGECPRCREVVDRQKQLDAVLDEWRSVDPTPGFDARVRQAVEAEQSRRRRWGLWGLGWVHGLAAASTAILIIAASVWLVQRHRHNVHPGLAARQPVVGAGHQASAPSLKAQNSNGSAHVELRRAAAAPEAAGAGDISNDDPDSLAMEDYDVAANFELLSEMPKADSHGGN